MNEHTRDNTRPLTLGERRDLQLGAPMSVRVVWVEGAGYRVPLA